MSIDNKSLYDLYSDLRDLADNSKANDFERTVAILIDNIVDRLQDIEATLNLNGYFS